MDHVTRYLMRYASSMSEVAGSPICEEHRTSLLKKAKDAILDLIESHRKAGFRSQEDALADVLAEVGQEVTKHLLFDLVDPQPRDVMIDGVPYRRVLDKGGSCLVSSPFGKFSVPRALYRKGGQRGVSA